MRTSSSCGNYKRLTIGYFNGLRLKVRSARSRECAMTKLKNKMLSMFLRMVTSVLADVPSVLKEQALVPNLGYLVVS